MRFTKMNGLGNDYIFLDGTKKEIKLSESEIKKLCDRNFGIGGDGIIIVTKASNADFGMKIYNSDGSTAEMCGNALRCLAKYTFKKRLTGDKYLKIQTDGGIRFAKINGDGTVTANMGKPVSDFNLIKLDFDIDISGYTVNAGNPHFVILQAFEERIFNEYAKKISEYRSIFPYKTNVEFAEIYPDKNMVNVRVYERGSGETLACGTGATAVFEICHHFGFLTDNAIVKLKGGVLMCSHNSKGEILVTGDAKFNYKGETDILNGE